MTTARKLVIVTSAVLLLLATGVLVDILWSARTPTRAIQERQPGMDRPAQSGGQADEAMAFTRGKWVPGTGVAANSSGAWPNFRGPNHDNIVTDPTPLARHWGTQGPAKLWSLDLGEGFAGAAVLNGRVYIIDYDQAHQADALRCLSLADGQEIWRFTYPVKIKRFHGMSRTIPAVTDKYTVSIGPKCHVVCVDTSTGKFIWGLDLVKEFDAEVPQWYAGQCPLVDGDRLILATGGDALMVAVELATGKVIWKAPNPRDWKMTHSSIAPMELAGQRMYAYCGSGGVAGVAASDGKLLWDTDAWTISIATIPQPLPVGDGKIFLSGGYNAGSLMLQLKHVENKIVAEPLFRLKPTEFGATQHTPILHDGHIYGVRPDGQLTCLDLNGKVRWASGGGAKFGMGSFIMAQGLMFLLNDDGWLTLAEVNSVGYRQLAKARVLPGQDAWAPLALVEGRLLARDMTQMVCLDVAGAKP
ncbi:MAG: polyvinylalcohol dehydrogenase [Verrucomicrobia bacterium]|nr:MAG: polyvinylalcohol dehydrogenase [Verrucomicrobiota bacterium]